MYNSVFTVEEFENGLRFANRTVVAFWTGSQIASGESVVFSGGAGGGMISGDDAGGTAYLFNGPSIITGDISASFPNDSGHMQWDGCTALEYLDVGGIGLESLTVNGCDALAFVYADANSMSADALNALYTSLPDRIGIGSGVIDVTSNSGTGSHNPDIATSKNWSFV